LSSDKHSRNSYTTLLLFICIYRQLSEVLSIVRRYLEEVKKADRDLKTLSDILIIDRFKTNISNDLLQLLRYTLSGRIRLLDIRDRRSYRRRARPRLLGLRKRL
jgi:hypothetical protein